jgi:hypothetical protein
MLAEHFYEMFVPIYQSTRHHIPKDCNLKNIGCPNKSARFKDFKKEHDCASRVVRDICRILRSTINCSVCVLYTEIKISALF